MASDKRRKDPARGENLDSVSMKAPFSGKGETRMPGERKKAA